jgi:hypothetical protein
LNVSINEEPESVPSTVLSLISLRNCTCCDISEPYAAVAIRHPPPLLFVTHTPLTKVVPVPQIPVFGGSTPTASYMV